MSSARRTLTETTVYRHVITIVSTNGSAITIDEDRFSRINGLFDDSTRSNTRTTIQRTELDAYRHAIFLLSLDKRIVQVVL